MKIKFGKTFDEKFKNGQILKSIFSIEKYYYSFKINIIIVFIVIYLILKIFLWKVHIFQNFIIELFIIMIIYKLISSMIKYRIIKEQLSYLLKKFNLEIYSGHNYDLNHFIKILKQNPAIWLETQRELLLIEKKLNILMFYGPMKTRSVQIKSELVNNQIKNSDSNFKKDLSLDGAKAKIKKSFNRFK